jgi:hypothetical protein
MPETIDELDKLLMDTNEFINHCLPFIKDTHDFIHDNLENEEY